METHRYDHSDVHKSFMHQPFVPYREHPSVQETTATSSIRSWTTDDVRHRLTQSGHLQRNDIELLHREDINGAALASLTHAHLQHIGVVTFGRRHAILESVAKLIHEPTATTHAPHASPQYCNTTLFPPQAHDKLPTQWQQLGFDRRTLRTNDGDLFGQTHKPIIRDDDDYNSGNGSRVIEPSLSARASKTADLSLRTQWQNVSLKRTSHSSRSKHIFSHTQTTQPQHASNNYALTSHTYTAAKTVSHAAFKHQVELEWIYGLHCHTATNMTCQQVLYNTDGAIIYVIDHCAVVLTASKAQQSHFSGHTCPITAMCQHPIDLNLMVTASAKDNNLSESVLYIWDSTNHQTMISLTSVSHPVASVAFNGNGSVLGILCSDPQHTLYLYEWTTSTWLLTAPLTSHDATQLRFNHRVLAEFVTIGNGFIALHTFDYASRTITTLTTPQLILPSPTVPHFTAVTYNSHGYVCAGTNDGDLYVFTSTQLLHHMTLHNGTLTCLDWHPDGIVSAGKDGFLHRVDDTFNVTSSLILKGEDEEENDREKDRQNNRNSDVWITAVQLFCSHLCLTTSRGDMLICDDWSDETNDIRDLQSVMTSDYDDCIIDVSSHRDVLFVSNKQRAITQLDINKHSAILQTRIIPSQPNARFAYQRKERKNDHKLYNDAAVIRISPCDTFAIIGCGETLYVYELQEMHCTTSLPLQSNHLTPHQSDAVSIIVFAPQSAIFSVGTRSGHILLCTYSRNEQNVVETQDEDADNVPKTKLDVVIRRVLTGHNSTIRQIQWSHDEKYVVSADDDDCLQYWNIDIASVGKSVPLADIKVNKARHNNHTIDWAKHNIHSLEIPSNLLPLSSPSMQITAIQAERGTSPALIAIGFSNGVVRLYTFPLDHRSQHSLHYSATASKVSLAATTSFKQVITGSSAIKQIEWSYNNKRLFVRMEHSTNIFQYKIY